MKNRKRWKERTFRSVKPESIDSETEKVVPVRDKSLAYVFTLGLETSQRRERQL